VARIVCHVRSRSDRVTFSWSAGERYFKPYSLTGAALDTLRHCSARASAPGLNELDQARLGHELHQAIFAGQDAIRDWLAGQPAGVLEIVSDTPGLLPWNLVYGQSPDAGAFAGNHPPLTPSPLPLGERGRGEGAFWGVRHALTSGGRLSVLRQLPTLDAPQVVAIIDAQVRASLPTAEQDRLQAFLTDKNVEVLTTRAQVVDGPTETAEVIWVLAPADANGLRLNNEVVTAADVREGLSRSPGSPEPVLFLNLTAAQSDALTAFRDFHGVVGAVQAVDAGSACSFGLQVIEDFLTSGQSIAAVLQKLRGQSPFPGLLYEARCPAGVRVVQDGQPADDLGAPAQELPDRPYRPLAPYDREHQALFSGRDQDLACFAALLDRADTRLLILHGSSSVGKTSFLQAGVTPLLKQSALGLQTLCDRDEGDGPPLVLRASGDLLGQLAAGLSAYCASSLTYQTPTGETVDVDLPGILARALQAGPARSTAITEAMPPPVPSGDVAGPASAVSTERLSPEGSGESDDAELWAVLSRQPAVLTVLLADIAAQLPHELLIIIDHAEELFTQAETEEDRKRRRAALQMLGRAAARGDAKFILALRSDYLGQLTHELPQHSPSPHPQPLSPEGRGERMRDGRIGVCEYLLNPLGEQQIMDALVLPTATDPILFSSEVPYAKYGFQYAAGVPKNIAQTAQRAAEDNQIGVLPIVQCMCARLAELAAESPDRIVREADLKRAGGVDEYLDRKLGGLALPKRTRNALRDLMPLLYSTHPDGTLTRDLVSARELKEHWTDSTPIQQAVEAAANDDDGLFEIDRLLVDGTRGLYVTLKQDALAQANHRRSKPQAGAQRQGSSDVWWIMIPLLVLALAFVFFFWRRGAVSEQRVANAQTALKEANEDIKKIVTTFKENQVKLGEQLMPLYAGTLANAEAAWKIGNVLRMDSLLASTQAELRAFEWYYLFRLAHRDRFFSPGPKSLISKLAVAPNGQLVAFTEMDGSVKLWDANKQAKSADFRPHFGGTATVAFADDGKTLVTAGVDGMVHLWDVAQLQGASPQPSKSLKNDAPVLALAVDAKNGIVAAGAGKKIVLWDLAKGEKRKELTEHGSEVLVLTFAGDGGTFASADADGVIGVWKADGEKIQMIKNTGTKLHSLALSPDGKLLAAGGVDNKVGTIRIWQTATGMPVGAAIEQGLDVNTVTFTPDGKAVLAGGKDVVIRAWDAESGRALGNLPGQYGWVRSSAFSADGSTFAASDDTGLRVWDTSTVPSLFPFARSPQFDVKQAHDGPVNSVASTSDGKVIVSGGSDGTVKLWNADGRLLATLSEPKNVVTSVAISTAAGEIVAGTATADGSGAVHTWRLKQDGDAPSAAYKGTVKELSKAIYCLAYSPDGRLLATGGVDKKISVFDAKDKSVREYEGATDTVRSVAFGGNGKELAAGGDDGILRLWNVESRKMTEFPREHGASIMAVMFYLLRGPSQAQSNQVIVTAGLDGGVLEWNIGEKKRAFTYKGHGNGASSLAVSPDERVIFTGSWDHTIKVFDTARGPERFTFVGHNAPVQCLTIGGSPATLVSGDRTGVLHFWRTASPKDVPGQAQLKDDVHPE